jgi:SpoVK/Ycf46/Vps4 family AAA+-type ATPase
MTERFFFPVPSELDRREILEIHLQGRGEFDLDALAVASDRLVGREIEQAIGEALCEAFDSGVLTSSILEEALRAKPRLMDLSEEVEALTHWCTSTGVHGGLRARMASEA